MEITLITTEEEDAKLAILAGAEDPEDYLTRRVLAYIGNVCLEADAITTAQKLEIARKLVYGEAIDLKERDVLQAALDTVSIASLEKP